MAGLTLAQAQTLLDGAVSALLRAQTVQNYRIGSGGIDRAKQNADLAAASADVTKWDAAVKQLSASASGRRRTYNIVSG